MALSFFALSRAFFAAFPCKAACRWWILDAFLKLYLWDYAMLLTIKYFYFFVQRYSTGRLRTEDKPHGIVLWLQGS